ncbi:hypothetical protein [Mesorhizobium delmotii]|uniref:Phage integrase n=1 Tax=Mesorhizobium delmotii TaxID=1631247 RepID=A0A2P9AT47_9HYPH
MRARGAAGSRLDKGMLVSLRGKTGCRQVELGRGLSDAICPIVALQRLKLACIAHGPFPARYLPRRAGWRRSAQDQKVARLLKRTALAHAAISRKANAEKLFAGHSLLAALASAAKVDERYVQKQLGHTSAEMTRRYQRRRDRFRVNLTKASGL